MNDSPTLALAGSARTAFLKRILSAAVILAVAVGALALGGHWFEALIALVVAAALNEYREICSRAGHPPPWWILAPLSAYLLFQARLPQLSLELALTLVTVCGLALLVVDPEDSLHAVMRWALALGGSLYVAWLLGYYLRLYFLPETGPHGLLLVLSVAGAAALGDTAAMVGGKLFGRRKLLPRISPNKTLEGAAVGLVVASLVMWLLAMGQGIPAGHGAILAIAVGASAQVGDLVESQFKRMANVKDSGALIPGHGGILDRIDSLLFPPAVVYLYLTHLGLA